MSMDPVAADYLGGHPSLDGAQPDGTLVIGGDALRFTTTVLQGVTFVPWHLDIPMASITAVSWLDRDGLERMRPYVWNTPLARVLGAAAFTPVTVRDRLLLVRLDDESILSFAVSATGAEALVSAITGHRGGPLPEVLPRQAPDPALAEIRDLLARQTELLERIAARLDS